jgi:DNA polymerase-1
VNIQQVGGKKLQAKMRGLKEQYPIRQLFVPESGLWLGADASQIEYRLFAHYAKPPAVIKAYAENPETDFHAFVMSMVQQVRSDITRERTKDLNFAKIYGAGANKIAIMLGLSPEEASPFVTAYDRTFPQARTLMDESMRVAEKRGYVKTMLGRRARFPNGKFLHAALNRVIQGTAADINKMKLVELHKERKYTGLKLRFTVHDEADGDVPDVEAGRRVREVLNRQSLPTRVPILWNVGVGPNWGSCKSVTEAA